MINVLVQLTKLHEHRLKSYDDKAMLYLGGGILIKRDDISLLPSFWWISMNFIFKCTFKFGTAWRQKQWSYLGGGILIKRDEISLLPSFWWFFKWFANICTTILNLQWFIGDYMFCWICRVRKQVVNIPSFIVRLDSQKHIDFSLKSPYGGGRPGKLFRLSKHF